MFFTVIGYGSVILGKRKPVSELLNCRSLTAIITAEIIDYPMKYALVHEWLTPKATGGSELVVKEILECVEADLSLIHI